MPKKSPISKKKKQSPKQKPKSKRKSMLSPKKRNQLKEANQIQ